MSVVTIGGTDYDGLTTVAEADAYLAADIARATAWAAITDADVKGRGIISATRYMSTLPWTTGNAPDPTSAGPFTTPISEVCAMLANDLIADPTLFANASSNSDVKVAKAGQASVEFFRPVDDAPPIPLFLWNLLEDADLVSADSAGTETFDYPYAPGTDYCDPAAYPWDSRWPYDWPYIDSVYFSG